MRDSIAAAVIAALVAITVSTPHVRADDGGKDAPEDAAARAAAKKAKKDAKDAKEAAERKAGDTLEVHGRVFTRATATKEETALGPGEWTNEFSLASARIGVDYQWREKVRAQVEYETTRDSLRDAFIELTLGHGLRLRAGRIKLPIGAIEQTSTWTLPTIDRGMVADVLADGLGMTGRSSALELRWRDEGPWRPTVTVTVAQGVRTTGGEQPGAIEDGGALTVAARAEVSPCLAQIAVVGASRVVNYGSAAARFWNAGLEVELDLEPISRGLRLWGDVHYGTSHLGAAVLADADRPFAAAELVAGYRFGGLDKNARYVEPFVGAGWFNPIADRKGDDTTEVVVGVAGGLWKRWRAQAQFGYQNAKSLRPAGLLGTADVNDRQRVTLQLGAAF